MSGARTQAIIVLSLLFAQQALSISEATSEEACLNDVCLNEKQQDTSLIQVKRGAKGQQEPEVGIAPGEVLVSEQANLQSSCGGCAAARGIGRDATLNEEGFKEVQDKCCTFEMADFIRRMIKKTLTGYDVCILPALSGLAVWYDCVHEGTFAGLMSEIDVNGKMVKGPCHWVGKIDEECKAPAEDANCIHAAGTSAPPCTPMLTYGYKYGGVEGLCKALNGEKSIGQIDHDTYLDFNYKSQKTYKNDDLAFKAARKACREECDNRDYCYGYAIATDGFAKGRCRTYHIAPLQGGGKKWKPDKKEVDVHAKCYIKEDANLCGSDYKMMGVPPETGIEGYRKCKNWKTKSKLITVDPGEEGAHQCRVACNKDPDCTHYGKYGVTCGGRNKCIKDEENPEAETKCYLISDCGPEEEAIVETTQNGANPIYCEKRTIEKKE